MIHLQQFNAYLKITTVQCLSQNKLSKNVLFQFQRWLAKNHGKKKKILWGWKKFFRYKRKRSLKFLKYSVRDRPFNLKGGGGVLWVSVSFRNYCSDNTRLSAIFFSRIQHYVIWQKLWIRLLFFSSTKIRIFFLATLWIRILF